MWAPGGSCWVVYRAVASCAVEVVAGEAMDDYGAWASSGGLDDDAFVRLLIRLTGQVVRTKPFPPPPDYGAWTSEAVTDFATHVFCVKDGRVLALKLLEKADDQGSLERQLLTTIERVLIDEAKKTAAGRLRRRLPNVLRSDPRFVHVVSPEGCWALVEGPTQLWQGDRDDLLRAALAVRVPTIRSLNEAGPTPAAAQYSLREAAYGVLAAAGGAVRDQDLAVVLLARFPLIAPVEAPVDVDQPNDHPSSDGRQGTESQALVSVTADEVWLMLTEQERAVLMYLDQEPEAWARSVSMRPGEAAVVVERLKEKLRLAVVNDEQASAVVRSLIEMSTAAGMGPPELRRLLKPVRGGDAGGRGP